MNPRPIEGGVENSKGPKSGALSPYERRVLEALAASALPAGRVFKAAGTPTLERFEKFLTEAGRAVGLGFRVLLWTLDIAAFLQTGSRFTRLSPERRERLLCGWMAGRGLRRALVFALTAPLKISHFDDPEIYAALGARFTFETGNEERPRYLDQAKSAATLSAGEVIEADAVVVGTGAGGAVVAKELAEAGLAVVILEEGRYHTRKDVTGHIWDAQKRFYRDKGFTFSIGNTVVPIPMGRAVGGSTAINTGTCWRTPDWVLERWVKELGLDEFAPDRLAPYFDRVEQTLPVHTADMKFVGGVGRVIARGCDRMGWSHRPLRRNAPDCDGAGVCDYGCPTDARRSMNLSYIPLALRSSALLLTEARADRVWLENGRAVGIEAQATGGGPRFRVRARAVVLACGTLLTPVLLLRQKLCNRSGYVGRNLSIHPATSLSALFDEPIRAFAAIPQGYCVDQFHRAGILLLGASAPVDLAATLFQLVGRDLVELMEAYERVAAFAVMVEDPSCGRVRIGPGGKPMIFYSVGREVLERITRGIELVGTIFLEAGASRLFPMVQGFPEVRDRRGLEGLKGARIRARDIFLSAYHPLGTCRIGKDPLRSVIDTNHQAHDLPGLYICDGSAVPTSVAVNPQETIMALATRAAEKIAGHLS
ncbi:MAG: GMC family oxidoreductase [Nitrospirae bacterium]|nr:GMC family oxidoreductase [Nitrospirota bacterium]